jgi:hypothetical protein
MGIVEILSYSLHFRVNGSMQPHELINNVFFNYGDESFYEKYKEHTPESLHEELKALDDLDLYLENNRDGYYQFFILTKEKSVAYSAFKTVVNLCKHLHGTTYTVDVIVKEKYVAESPTTLSF